MLSGKKLIRMARKWQRLTAIKRKRISFPRKPVADKGHFVAYSADNKRFQIPLLYLNNDIFRELFKWAEKEFGLPNDGPITFPCDAVFMEYAISLIQRQVDKGIEKALSMSIATGLCLYSSYVDQDQRDRGLVICGF